MNFDFKFTLLFVMIIFSILMTEILSEYGLFFLVVGYALMFYLLFISFNEWVVPPVMRFSRWFLKHFDRIVLDYDITIGRDRKEK